MDQSLQEFCSSRGVALRIDRAAGMLRGVKLLGLTSKNGREYPDATLARAAALYEGAKVNVNHPKGHPLAPRDYQDRLGTIKNVAARPGVGLFGDLLFNPKHALAEQLVWDAEHAPENVGFSHNVEARTARRGDQTIVEEILAVASVDLVADPATTRGLFESAVPAHNTAPLAANSTLAPGSAGGPNTTVTSASPPLPASLSPPLPVSASQPLCQHCVEHSTEIGKLRAEINQLQAAQAIATKRATIAALLVEHGLPPLDSPSPLGRGLGRGNRDTAASAITSDSFVQSLFAAPDELAIRALVRERAQLVEQARRWPAGAAAQPSLQPRSRDQTLAEAPHGNTLDEFLKAIRA